MSDLMYQTCSGSGFVFPSTASAGAQFNMKDAVTHVGTYKDLCTKVANIETCSLGHQGLGMAVKEGLAGHASHDTDTQC